MLIYAMISTILIKQSIATAAQWDKGIKQSEKVPSPFVLGLILSSGLRIYSCVKILKQLVMITACPVAFSENGVKTRIIHVMNYKKPAFWGVAIVVIVCAVVAVCFLTNPKQDTLVIETNKEEAVSVVNDYICEKPGFGNWELNGNKLVLSDEGSGIVKKFVFIVDDGTKFIPKDKMKAE